MGNGTWADGYYGAVQATTFIGQATTQLNSLTHFNLTSPISSIIETTTGNTTSQASVARITGITIIGLVLMVTTVLGNALVIASYRTNRRLRSINNMFLVSLACSDLVIGVVSMTLYPLQMITRKWLFGPVLCDIWLCMDYTLSMASVANLLLICCDRYFSVTRPFTYRVKRTRSRTRISIVCAWILSCLMWSPAIVIWPIVRERTVPHDQCYIQFLQEDPGITVVTALLAFYLPVLVMAILYGLIFRETRKCSQYLEYLRSQRRSRTASIASPFLSLRRRNLLRRSSATNSPRLGSNTSNPWQTGNTARTSFASNGVDDQLTAVSASNRQPGDCSDRPSCLRVNSIDAKSSCGTKSPDESPHDGSLDVFVKHAETKRSQNRPFFAKRLRSKFRKSSSRHENNANIQKPTTREMNLLLPPAAHPLSLVTPRNDVLPQDPKRTEQTSCKAVIPSSEKKAGRTLSAILIAFIITWLPYNVCAVYSSFCKGGACIPQEAWDAAYYLCYINSTVNPFCFALCNKTFRKTFVQLLSCKRSRSNVSLSVTANSRNKRTRATYPQPSSSSSKTT